MEKEPPGGSSPTHTLTLAQGDPHRQSCEKTDSCHLNHQVCRLAGRGSAHPAACRRDLPAGSRLIFNPRQLASGCKHLWINGPEAQRPPPGEREGGGKSRRFLKGFTALGGRRERARLGSSEGRARARAWVSGVAAP